MNLEGSTGKDRSPQLQTNDVAKGSGPIERLTRFPVTTIPEDAIRGKEGSLGDVLANTSAGFPRDKVELGKIGTSAGPYSVAELRENYAAKDNDSSPKEYVKDLAADVGIGPEMLKHIHDNGNKSNSWLN